MNIFGDKEVFDVEDMATLKGLVFFVFVLTLEAIIYIPAVLRAAHSVVFLLVWAALSAFVLCIWVASVSMIVYLAAYLRKLRSPVIVCLYEHMCDGELHSIGELASGLDLMPDAIRIYLKCMIRAGYIESSDEGGIRYRLVKERIAELERRISRLQVA